MAAGAYAALGRISWRVQRTFAFFLDYVTLELPDVFTSPAQMGSGTLHPVETLTSFSRTVPLRVGPEGARWFSTLASSREDIKHPG